MKNIQANAHNIIMILKLRRTRIRLCLNCLTMAFVTVGLLGGAFGAAASIWTNLVGGNASGTWGVAANWSGGIPDGTGAIAEFSTLNLTVDSTVTNDTARTVGTLLFAGAVAGNDWTLIGSALTLAVSSGSPLINVSNQTATISLTLAGSQGFTKGGAGTLGLAASNNYTGATVITNGTLQLPGIPPIPSGTVGYWQFNNSTNLGADSSGEENTLTTATGAAPTYVTGAMNGLPVVRFNSAKSTCLTFPRPVQDDFTIMCVYQSSQGIGSGAQFYQGAGLVNGEVGGVVNDFGTSLNANGKLLAGTGNPDTTVVSSGSIYANGYPHLFTFKRTRSAGAIVLYADGAQAGMAIGGTQSLTSPENLVLGAQQTLNNYLTGDIAEVKVFNSPLSDSDRIAEENALKCKYGLGGGAPPPVPAGLTGLAGDRQISVSWAPTAGAMSYNLWWSTNSSGPYTLTATGLTTNSYADRSAVSGLTNSYKIAAVDSCGASANSAAVSVLLPLPALGINVSAGSLTISWPGWAGGWTLYSTTNLAPPAVWLPVTNTVGSSNGTFNVTAPIGSNVQFFRLSGP